MNTAQGSKIDNDKVRADLEQIKIFLFNVSERTPNAETYDSWQRSLEEAIKKFPGVIVPPHCPRCKGTEFRHEHDCAHGIAGTHMVGSERFICRQCGNTIKLAEGKPLGFKFILDRD